MWDLPEPRMPMRRMDGVVDGVSALGIADVVVAAGCGCAWGMSTPWTWMPICMIREAMQMREYVYHTLFSKSSHQLGHVFSTHRFSSMMVPLTTVASTENAIATRWSS